MPRDLTQDFLNASSAESVRTIYLYKFEMPDGTYARYAQYPTTLNSTAGILWNSEIYIPFSIAHRNIEKNIDQEIQSLTIMLGNVSKEAISLVTNTDFRGKRIWIYEVPIAYIDDPDDYRLIFKGLINRFRATETSLEAICTYHAGLTLSVLAPQRIFSVLCNYKFKSTWCGYTGSTYSTCNKTLSNCELRARTDNFSGWVFLPGLRDRLS